MKKALFYILLTVAAILPALQACNDEDTVKEIQYKLSGTWQLIYSEGWDYRGPEDITWGGPASGLYWTLHEKDLTGNDHETEEGLGETYDWLYEDDYLVKYNLTTGYREQFYIEKLSAASLTVSQSEEDGSYLSRLSFTKISKY